MKTDSRPETESEHPMNHAAPTHNTSSTHHTVPKYQTYPAAILQGALIGLGAVLPGISGGVLSVIFGIYRPLMELLADPLKTYRTHLPRLFPYILGSIIGFLGVANILSFFLNRYPAPSVCLFIGLIIGMLPSLWEEAGKEGRTSLSYAAFLLSALFVLLLLTGLQYFSIQITPNFNWYVFCGCCLALSIIAPGMSFSTLLMPLGLYTPFIDGIGHLSFDILIPGGIGALVTITVLSKIVNRLFTNHYSIAFHGIAGIVMAATAMIIPFDSFTTSFLDLILNLSCLFFGLIASAWLSRFNARFQTS